MAVSLVLGLVTAGVYMYKNTYSKSFAITLAILPAAVQLVIVMVNGQLGAGIAVAGAFGLVRFRSVPGNAREIGSVFMAMAVGLATGMGYIWIGLIFTAIISAFIIILVSTRFGESKNQQRQLTVVIPEDLDYTKIFDDIFEKYTRKNELIQVKTANMGSLYQLKYHIVMKNPDDEKNLLDEMRCRNGNLTISCGRVANGSEEL